MTHTHTKGRSTSVRGKRAPLAATAAAAVVVVVLAGTAHAQDTQTTVFSTSSSIASGTEGIVLTDTYSYVNVVGPDVDAPGLAAAEAVAAVANEDGFGQAFSESVSVTADDFPQAFTNTFASASGDVLSIANARAFTDPDYTYLGGYI